MTQSTREAFMVKAKDSVKPIREIVGKKIGGITSPKFAPTSDWSKVSDHEHFVQFYETDAYLRNSLRGFIGTGLVEGDACIVAAKKEHLENLEVELLEDGLDMPAFRACGLYVALDAVETLSKFMVDGFPEPRRFEEII